MRRAYPLAMTVVVLIASGTLALGQTPKKTSAEEEVEGTIATMDHIWLDAAYNHDGGSMAWLFADDFVEVHPGGEIVNKQQQIDQILDPTRSILEIHPDNIQVRYVSADVAVLTDITTIRGTSGGVTYNGKQRVIRVFVKQLGRWRAAGAGITHLAAQ